MKEVLTTQELLKLCELLHRRMSRQALHYHIDRGNIKAFHKVGRFALWHQDAVRSFLKKIKSKNPNFNEELFEEEFNLNYLKIINERNENSLE